MAPGAFPFFWGLTLIAFFCHCSGNRGRHQVRFNQIDRLNSEPMKVQRFQPGIFEIQNESEAPMGLDMRKAIQEFKELAPKVLRDLKPMRAVSPKQLARKKKKRWAHSRMKRNPLEKRAARSKREAKRRLKSVDTQDSVVRRSRRQVCVIGNKHNCADRSQKSVAQKQAARCARSAYFGGKEPSLEAEPNKGSKRGKTDQGGKISESVLTSKTRKEHILRLKWRRGQKRGAHRGKRQSAPSVPVDSHDSSYSLSSSFTPSSARSSFRREKESPPSFHGKANSAEDAFWKQRREKRKTRTLPKKRDVESKESLSVKTVRLALRALQTQKKLSEMVDQLSNPSSHMSREEKLSYMHELLDELKLFIKLLQEQILLQSLNEVQDLTTVASALA